MSSKTVYRNNRTKNLCLINVKDVGKAKLIEGLKLWCHIHLCHKHWLNGSEDQLRQPSKLC
jgi:hypothetical protein